MIYKNSVLEIAPTKKMYAVIPPKRKRKDQREHISEIKTLAGDCYQIYEKDLILYSRSTKHR